MTRTVTLIVALALLGACGSTGNDGSNPLQDAAAAADGEDAGAETGGDGAGDGGAPIASDGSLPPGTASPSPGAGIFRRESLDIEAGTGFARDLSYDSASDTFRVNGLAFDGDQPGGAAFARSAPGSLTSPGSPSQAFALYEAPVTQPDFLTDEPIGQFEHRALYGVSDSGETEFAIVRTGNYIPYGFGGFVYQRKADVVLPTTGQAVYRGLYGGLRDFDGAGGIETVTGDARVTIDFGAFGSNCDTPNCADAVSGFVGNRRVFDPATGRDLTPDIVAAINADTGTSLTRMPTLTMRVGPGVLDANGEITGEIQSVVDGTFETGTYYAIMSGDHRAGGEIVGVVVVEATDPRFEGSVTVRETGGFIVER